MRAIFIFLVCIPFLAKAGGENDPAGARAAAMANSGLCFQDIWSIYHNQAGLAYIPSPTAGVFFENKFMVKDLAYAGFAGAMPLGNGAIGVTYTNFGFSSYKQGNIGVAYGMRLSHNLSIGLQLNYQTINIATDNYGKTGAVTADLGFLFQVSEKVSLAAHISNPTRTKINDYNDERIPTILRIGAGYQISDDLFVTGDVEKDIDEAVTVRGGIEYKPADILYLRVGASTNPNLLAFGIGLDFNAFRFDLATTYHSYLGYSPMISLTYAPGKK